MKNYKRLTFKRLVEPYDNDCEETENVSSASYEELVNRLAELENKIEDGTLIFIDEPFYSECDNCWAVFQRKNDNVITCQMTERQARNYKKFRKIENEAIQKINKQ